jgi:RNA polymerase-binding transcription factor DksA
MTRPTTQQVQAIRNRLVAQRKALLASTHDEIARWGEHPMGEVAGEVPDAGDESVAVLMTDLDHAVLKRHVGEIRDIDAALVRMREREYGLCVDCGDDIDVERLSVFPTARRCVRCQSRRERTYAEVAAPTL